MSSPLYWAEQQPNGLYAVHDDRGPVERFTDIETFGEARDHALDLCAEAREADASQVDFDAAAPALLIALNDLMAEAA